MICGKIYCWLCRPFSASTRICSSYRCVSSIAATCPFLFFSMHFVSAIWAGSVSSAVSYSSVILAIYTFSTSCLSSASKVCSVSSAIAISSFSSEESIVTSANLVDSFSSTNTFLLPIFGKALFSRQLLLSFFLSTFDFFYNLNAHDTRFLSCLHLHSRFAQPFLVVPRPPFV